MKIFRAVALLTLVGLLPTPPVSSQESGNLVQKGKEVYADHCAACHRTNGEGLPAKFPALKGNSLVLGDAGPVISTVLHGREGRLGLMPSWKDTLNDQEVAGVVSYIRQEWGNQAPPVTPEAVAKIRGQ